MGVECLAIPAATHILDAQRLGWQLQLMLLSAQIRLANMVCVCKHGALQQAGPRAASHRGYGSAKVSNDGTRLGRK